MISAALHSDLEDFYARVSDRLLSGGAINKIPEWIERNTTLKGRPWAFRDHEFQVAIAADTAYEVVVMKCSQVGLSELQVRFTLGFLSIKQGTTGIYVLPHRNFAQKFAKGRIDPVIEGSEKLSNLAVAAANSSEMKRFGLSTLYIGGASTDTQAISIPADFLVEDEYDFCNPAILGKYESRLRHAENGGFRRKFSTPTLPGYGIALEYESSSKARYLCKCEHCEQWVKPDFHRDVHIPGFSETFDKFEKDNLHDPDVQWEDAYIRCVNCGRALDPSLAVAERREWVHEFPSIAKHGYAVKPFDLIKYNSTPSVIEQIGKYDSRQDYENFVQGNPYKSKFTEIDAAMVRNNAVEDVAMHGNGFFMGVDVGKVIHVTLGKKIDGRYRFLRFMRIRVAEQNALETLKELFILYGCYRMVIDSQPDYTLCQNLQVKFGEYVNPCVYVKDSVKKPKYFELQEDETHMVYAQRTKGLDKLVEAINEGRSTFCKTEELKDVVQHYGGMKRVEQINEEGERVARWQKITETDHFFHSTFYCKLAIDMDEGDESAVVIPAPTRVMSAKIGETLKHGPEMGVSAAELVKMMGFGR